MARIAAAAQVRESVRRCSSRWVSGGSGLGIRNNIATCLAATSFGASWVSGVSGRSLSPGQSWSRHSARAGVDVLTNARGLTWHRMTSPSYIANSRKHTLISSQRKARAYSLLGESSCTGYGPASSPIRISRSRSTKLPCLEPMPEPALSPVKLRFNPRPRSRRSSSALTRARPRIRLTAVEIALD
jgi:hypothetical protein